MRLHLTIQRHGLPVTRILWTTSPPSLLGPHPSIIPAASSAVTSSRMPNALYSNGGYTIAQLLEDVNEVIPLETEPRLLEDESSGQWGLEDYAVEVGGSECLHFMELEGILRDGDEVLIRALQMADLKARRISGRHQISGDGKHLIDGVPFGKPFLKRPTSSRPAITIPPRKKRRTALAIWGSGSNYGDDDAEYLPQSISQNLGTGKELSLLKPETELEPENADEHEDAYQDDYEDFHEPVEDFDGTVIRHEIDKTSEGSESDHEAGSEGGDLSQELQDLRKDMDVKFPEMETPDRRVSRGQSLRSRPSTIQPAPRKSSISRRSTLRPSDSDSVRGVPKSVSFGKQNPEVPTAQVESSILRAGSTSEEPEHAMSSESDSDSSSSDSSASGSSDEESSNASEGESGSGSAAGSDSSDSDSDSSSESSASDSDSEVEEDSKLETVLQPVHKLNPPGAGTERTRKSNQRAKMRRRLTKLKEMGALDENADFDALREFDLRNDSSFNFNSSILNSGRASDVKSAKEREQEDFEAKRAKLLRDLESGGVDVSFASEKENASPRSLQAEVSELPEEQDSLYETANDATPVSPDLPKRRSLDVASTRRLLFGSLGVRNPRSKEDEEATRKKLAGKIRESTARAKEEELAEIQEEEPEVDWRQKLIVGATECFHDDIELSAPPFPFEQRWDAEADAEMRRRSGRNKKRKRRQQVQVYDEEVYDNGVDHYFENDDQLNYDDSELPEADVNQDESDETTKTAVDTDDDLPDLPSDTSSLQDLAGTDLKPGLVLAFKQLDVSKETNWQPTVSDYRVAVVSEVFVENILNIQLAKPYRRQPKDEDADGPFKYSGFEMPGMEDEDEVDDGFREVPFDDLIEPKLLRAAPAAEAEEKDSASILPADEEQPAQDLSQSIIEPPAAGHDDHVSDSSQQPASHKNASPDAGRTPSPAPSPRFEGFELSQEAPDPIVSDPLPIKMSDAPDKEEAAVKGEDNTQSALPSTCPPNLDSHELHDTGSTDQLRTISSPGSSVVSIGSHHKLMDIFLSQPSPQPKSEHKSSPIGPGSDAASPTVPNPFYEIDRAYEERRQRTQGRAERNRSFDKPSREPSPSERKRAVSSSPARRTKEKKRAVSSSPPRRLKERKRQVSSSPQRPKENERQVSSSPPRRLQKRKAPSPVEEPSTQEKETSPLSMIPDSMLPEARDPSPPASQMPDPGSIVDLTQSSPPVSPGGSDEDFAKTHRLPRGSGWVQKNDPPRRKTRQSQSSQSTRAIRTRDTSISPPRRKKGRPSRSSRF